MFHIKFSERAVYVILTAYFNLEQPHYKGLRATLAIGYCAGWCMIRPYKDKILYAKLNQKDRERETINSSYPRGQGPLDDSCSGRLTTEPHRQPLLECP